MTSRYDAENRCKSKGVKSTEIEDIVWRDIEQWLNHPGDLIIELDSEQDKEKARLVEEAERQSLEISLTSIENERKGYLRQNVRGIIGETELLAFLTELEQQKAAIQKRLDELKPQDQPEENTISPDLLEELRHRLKQGLSEQQRQEIARLLIRKIIMRTNIEGHIRTSIAEIDYRFPLGAVSTGSGRGS